MGEDAHMIDDMTPREMYRMLKEARADIMLSGGRSQFIALKAKMPWLDINQERHYAYMGYVGMVALVHEIEKSLFNPVWTQVRLQAPWEEVTWDQREDQAIELPSASQKELSPPQSDAEKRRSRLVCNCAGVDRATIEDAIVGWGLVSSAEVSQLTHAGTGCGGCVGKLDRILETQEHWRSEIDLQNVVAA